MNSLFKAAGEHWAVVLKIVCGLVAAGMFLARIPSSEDLENINDNLVKILTEQRERIDQHDVDIANRLTREDVEKMIVGPVNPWVQQSSTVMPVVTRYAEDRDKMRDDISDIWRALSARRGGGK